MSSKKAAAMTIGNIDGSRDLSDSWTGFTQFTPLDEKAPEGHMWSGEINEKTADIQARSCLARTLGQNACGPGGD